MFFPVWYEDVPSYNDSYAGGDSSSNSDYDPEEDIHDHLSDADSAIPHVTEFVEFAICTIKSTH